MAEIKINLGKQFDDQENILIVCWCKSGLFLRLLLTSTSFFDFAAWVWRTSFRPTEFLLARSVQFSVLLLKLQSPSSHLQVIHFKGICHFLGIFIL